MKTLPPIMVAPNGARRKKADHPALPVTIEELVETAQACFAAGADAIHAHMRDQNQNHVLDAGLYREFIDEMARTLPQMHVQITTEAVGRYTPQDQRKLVEDVMPEAVSVSLTEMRSDGDERSASRFYHWAGDSDIAVQHILYSIDELEQFLALRQAGFFADQSPQLLFVLGRYTKNQQSDPAELALFLQAMKKADMKADWAVCAFGVNETACALKAFELGGKARIGFENSIWNADGTLATDNAERVGEIFEANKTPFMPA